MSTGATVVAPLGAPSKPSDLVALSVISRVPSITRDEHQGESNVPFVVWVDLQSVSTLAGFDNKSQFQPINNDGGELGGLCLVSSRRSLGR